MIFEWFAVFDLLAIFTCFSFTYVSSVNEKVIMTGFKGSVDFTVLWAGGFFVLGNNKKVVNVFLLFIL